MSTLYDKALEIAILAHKGQIDSDGFNHIEHCKRIANKLSDTNLRVIAILHDSVEDNNKITINLISTTLSAYCAQYDLEFITRGIYLLTGNEFNSYGEYILNLKENAHQDVIKIKLFDMQDNLNRVIYIEEEKRRTRLIHKYVNSIAFLEDKLSLSDYKHAMGIK